MLTAVVGLLYVLLVLNRPTLQARAIQARAWWGALCKYDRSSARFYTALAVLIPAWIYCGTLTIIYAARY